MTGSPATLDMLTSCRLNTPDGDSDQVTFLNGVTRGATTAGSAASPGPGFLTGTYASKKQAATVQAWRQCTHRLFLYIWDAATREGGFLVLHNGIYGQCKFHRQSGAEREEEPLTCSGSSSASSSSSSHPSSFVP